MNEDSILLVVTAALIMTCVVAVVLIHLRRQRVLETALRERERTIQLLTERFGASAEFVAFASSPEAALLFSTMDAPAAMARRIIALAAAAALLAAIGAGFWLNAFSIAGETDINFIRRAADERWWGTFCLAAGAGLGGAAALSTRLARRWGLVGR